MLAGIPDFARNAALDYLRTIPRAMAQRGEDYVARKRVRKIEAFPDGVGFYAEVTGTQDYEVVASFDKRVGRWICDCDCPVGVQFTEFPAADSFQLRGGILPRPHPATPLGNLLGGPRCECRRPGVHLAILSAAKASDSPA